MKFDTSMLDRLRGLPIGTKLAASAIGVMLSVLGVAISVVSWQVWTSAQELGTRTLSEAAQSTVDILRVYDDAARRASSKDIGLFKREFSGNFTLAQEERSETSAVSVLSDNGVPLNGNVELVDRFTEVTGAVATVFARQDEDFVRITTSVKKADGSRAIGTMLDRKHPAYALMVEGKPYIGRAVLFGKTYATYYEPIQHSGRTIGILFIGTDLSEVLSSLTEVMRARRPFDGSFVYAVDISAGPTRGTVIGRRSAEGGSPAVPLDAAQHSDFTQRLVDGGSEGAFDAVWTPSLGSGAGGAKRVVYARSDAWDWAVVSEAPLDQVMAGARGTLVMLWVANAIGVCALLVVILWLSRRLVAEPVRALRAALTRLAEGDLAIVLESSSRDELGQLTAGMEAFRQKLWDAFSTVRANAENVSSASSQIAVGNQDLSRRTELQASALQQTVATTHELGATVQRNAESAVVAGRLSQEASEVAVQGGSAVDKVVVTMQGIAQSSRRIGDIIGVIDSIAFQTNVLALNAAVEAARAGESGRGFAVVATEVRTLAQRSADAAKEIKALIAGSVEQVQQGTALVDHAGQQMNEVVTAAQRVAEIVSGIAAASAEQRDSVFKVREAVSQIDQSTQQNAALVEQSAAAAESLNVQAQRLVQVVALFRLTDGEVRGD